jgi:hypothetical protein
MDNNRKVKAIWKAGSDKKRKKGCPTRTWDSEIRKLLKQRHKNWPCTRIEDQHVPLHKEKRRSAWLQCKKTRKSR